MSLRELRRHDHAYLRNSMSDLGQILCMLRTSVARSSSGGVAICYVLPVLWMTSCLYIMAGNRRRNTDSVGSSMDLPPWRILKLTHQGAAPDRGRSLKGDLLCLELVNHTGVARPLCTNRRGLSISNVRHCFHYFAL